jgi:hypothetical protein
VPPVHRREVPALLPAESDRPNRRNPMTTFDPVAADL